MKSYINLSSMYVSTWRKTIWIDVAMPFYLSVRWSVWTHINLAVFEIFKRNFVCRCIFSKYWSLVGADQPTLSRSTHTTDLFRHELLDQTQSKWHLREWNFCTQPTLIHINIDTQHHRILNTTSYSSSITDSFINLSKKHWEPWNFHFVKN